MAQPEQSTTEAQRLAELREQLSSVEPLRETAVTLPRSGKVYRIEHPMNMDPLIDAVADDPEQNLPYWAELWPSGVALADAILGDSAMLKRNRVLEIGCGLGVTAIAALEAGADLTVTDYAAESLLLTRYNALVNTGREPATLEINWRKPSEELLATAGEGFPVVLAADVLYESRDVQPLLDLVEQLVRPGGMLWLAQPGRPVASRFVQFACERGWSESTPDGSWDGPWPDPNDAGVQVTVHRLFRVPEWF